MQRYGAEQYDGQRSVQRDINIVGKAVHYDRREGRRRRRCRRLLLYRLQRAARRPSLSTHAAHSPHAGVGGGRRPTGGGGRSAAVAVGSDFGRWTNVARLAVNVCFAPALTCCTTANTTGLFVNALLLVYIYVRVCACARNKFLFLLAPHNLSQKVQLETETTYSL